MITGEATITSPQEKRTLARRNHMARDGKTRIAQPNGEQEEMTVVILRFKGGGETLRKGFDTVSQALATLGPTTVVERRPPLLGKGAAATPVVDKLPGSDGDGASPEVPPEGEEAEALEVDAAGDSARRASGGPRRYPKPQFDSTLKLDAGDVTFKRYCAQKQLDSDSKKYLVAAAWLTNHGGHPSFTASQIFTCFRAMGWNEQADFMQPVRLMKSKKSYFERGPGKSWKLTQVGIHAADAIAPKTK
jgi:hypothetical protein